MIDETAKVKLVDKASDVEMIDEIVKVIMAKNHE